MIQERDARGRIVKTNGRATGSKNKRPNIWTVLPSDAVADLYRTLFELAKGGDTGAAKLLLDRLDPTPKGRPVELPGMPPIDGLEGAQQAGRRVLEAMLAGELSPDEAGQVLGDHAADRRPRGPGLGQAALRAAGADPMRSLATVGRQIEQLVRARSQQRQVIVAAGSHDTVDWREVRALEEAGLEVVIVITGIVRGPLDPLDGEEAGPCGP
jgi:hypothetical protein